MADSGSITFLELFERARRLATGLSRTGIRAGDVVGFQLPNEPQALVVHLALMWVGAVSLPLGTALGRRELAYALADSGARLLIVQADTQLADPARRVAAERGIPALTAGSGAGSTGQLMDYSDAAVAVVRRRDSDPAVLLYTSGTTSRSKGVLHSERCLVFDADSIVQGDGIGPEEVVFAPSSISHVAGVAFLLFMPLVQGNTACTLRKWNASEAIALMQRNNCTWASGAPTFLRAIVKAVARAQVQLRVRVFRCGGADVPPALIRNARSLGIQAYRCYGCSEYPTITGRAADSGERAADTDGRIHPHIAVRIVDAEDGSRDVAAGVPGEILVKGPEMFLRYTDSRATAEAIDSDGWLHTGDLGVLDEERFLSIIGRKKDLIIRKGENISAREIEDVISAHEGVLDVAVVGIPDEERGQLVCAFVVPRAAVTVDMAGLRRHLDEAGLARFKWPERIEIIDVLPRTASGKVRKDELRARAIAAATGPQKGSAWT